MTVENFIKEYNKATDKKKEIQNHVLDKYIKYEEKILMCKKIIERTLYSKINEKRVYINNTALRYCLHTMTLIDLYTDIDVDFQNVLKDFNLLEENKVTNLLISHIDELEMKRFSQVLNWCLEDEIDNERNLTSYIENKLESFGYLGDALSKTIGDVNNG